MSLSTSIKVLLPMPGKDAFKSDHYSKSVVMIYTEVSLVDATFCVKWLARLTFSFMLIF